MAFQYVLNYMQLLNSLLNSLYFGLPIKPIWNTFAKAINFIVFYNNLNCFIIIIEIRKVMIIIFISKLWDRNNSIQKPDFSTFRVLTLFDRSEDIERKSWCPQFSQKTNDGIIFSTGVIR